MASPKYTYSVQSFYLDRWIEIIKGETRDFCLGYLYARKDMAPRNAYRLIRSDEKILEETPAEKDVSIGMIASWPTAQQYDLAAAEAMKQAARIRAEEAKREGRHV